LGIGTGMGNRVVRGWDGVVAGVRTWAHTGGGGGVVAVARIMIGAGCSGLGAGAGAGTTAVGSTPIPISKDQDGKRRCCAICGYATIYNG
jgi:hypothetical protein